MHTYICIYVLVVASERGYRLATPIYTPIYMQVAPSNERGSTSGSEIIRLHTLRVLNSIAQHLPEEKMSGQCMEIYAYLLGVHGGFEAPELLVVVLQGVCLMARRGDSDTRLLPRMLSKYRYPLV